MLTHLFFIVIYEVGPMLTAQNFINISNACYGKLDANNAYGSPGGSSLK